MKTKCRSTVLLHPDDTATKLARTHSHVVAVPNEAEEPKIVEAVKTAKKVPKYLSPLLPEDPFQLALEISLQSHQELQVND